MGAKREGERETDGGEEEREKSLRGQSFGHQKSTVGVEQRKELEE